ncbi:hypothetical protein [Methylocystis parvus]|uniref:Uncharacterized protein n=1 Tax=Methylocystis parvus TaxID=134 RepID=A0A6B8M7N1_9HYPH|nr:hypothetical protein [Methylocystis parvus]QGN00105.1 hypothetical protein F7D14_21240 [Methylocystis parvus]WBK02395.1 hypothetical protein MMG94_21400 [Methylocystis parvus OBBP]
MRKYAIVSGTAFAVVMISSSAYAVCDVHKANEDKQAKCVEKCEDSFLERKMHYGSDINQVYADKKACDAACNCPQNTEERK